MKDELPTDFPEHDRHFGNDLPESDRREFLKQSVAVAGLSMAPFEWHPEAGQVEKPGNSAQATVSLFINGKKHNLTIDPRTTLLDLLRENLHLTGTKKGCDLGQCGACTVHIDGQRALSCLTFAIMQNGRKIMTVEGIGSMEKLHPLQDAFIRHDGFQCGYCTPGQLMSAICCIREKKAGSKEDIREYMSGNLCRCGAYPNIVEAIMEVGQSGQKV